jgi:SAM-dependent methyltransferase
VTIDPGPGASRDATRDVVVVLPIYGGHEALPAVIRDLAVAAYGLRARAMALSVLLLDGSGQGAVADAVAVGADLSLEVEAIPGPRSGAGQAYLEGFRVAIERGADLIVTLDANGRHDATEIPRIVDRLVDRDLDVVIGSRWTRGSGTPGLTPLRWLLGRAANQAFRFLTGTHGIRDATTSFRVARSEVVRGFEFGDVPVNSHSVQTTFVADAIAKGYRVAEAPIIYRQPVKEGGEMSSGDIGQFLGHLLHLRRRVDRVRQRRLSRSGRRFADDFFGAAEDLERLGTARNFFDWVLEEFHPYIRGRVLEVGAGLGTITRKLAERYPDVSIVALEPADNMFSDLEAFAALEPRVIARRETLGDYRPEVHGNFDVALYLNVLEHIDDDERELHLAYESLRPGGSLLIFGPALEWLYSELDYRAGHYRRYSVKGIRRLVSEAGFEVLKAKYFDALGVAPYYLVYRLLGHSEIAGSTLWGYDRLMVPLSRLLQTIVPHPPAGKNVILVARKPR